MFVHEDPEFEDLLRIVADQRGLSVGLVEKDYWVTRTLWALLHQGYELWFKGGTSLSKGFGIIQRFSEDLDLRVDPGTVAGLPAVMNWRSQGTSAVAQRRAHIEQLASTLHVPGAAVSLDEEFSDALWRNAGIRVVYPGKHLAD
ncbi:MAG: nucleotidyl transferase AbiEii/AbiGii toxin family protein, partial [Dehalococcoidia bacterium]